MSSASAFDIQSLLTPKAFSHPIDAISLAETHVSWVVLTGPFAYKIKKPLRLDFLDASTLERRRFLCDEELRLNRRFAAELYLDVVPIVSAESGVHVGGLGRTIEYAVRMKQFAPADQLSSLLDRNDVARQEIEALAQLLSDCHAQAPRDGQAAPNAQRIIRTVLANMSELQASEPPVDRAALAGLSAWIRNRIAHERALLERRERDGGIRECHGDLHAGNVVRYEGRLLPFDCLEFDPDLRWIDVIDDVGFLVMDLASHGREDLAFVLLSRYLESSGDYPAVALLPLYAVHRALVRAKVDALSARSVPEQRAQFVQRLERRLRAAHSWAAAGRPMLILMHGVSGSGKSWLSERLVPALPGVRIRSDVERKRLAGVAANEGTADRLQGDIYSRAFSRRTYAQVLSHAEACLRSGLMTIVDATFLDASERRSFLGLAERLEAPGAIVSCGSDPKLMAERIRARARSDERVSDADTAVLAAQLRALQPFAATEENQVIRVDTSEPNALADTVRALRKRAG